MDIETRRKKQQALMIKMVERQVRSRAQQIYETRGLEDGKDLQDWFQAESEVLENNVVAPLYRRVRSQKLQTVVEANEPLSEIRARCGNSCRGLAIRYLDDTPDTNR